MQSSLTVLSSPPPPQNSQLSIAGTMPVHGVSPEAGWPDSPFYRFSPAGETEWADMAQETTWKQAGTSTRLP